MNSCFFPLVHRYTIDDCLFITKLIEIDGVILFLLMRLLPTSVGVSFNALLTRPCIFKR